MINNPPPPEQLATQLEPIPTTISQSKREEKDEKESENSDMRENERSDEMKRERERERENNLILKANCQFFFRYDTINVAQFCGL